MKNAIKVLLVFLLIIIGGCKKSEVIEEINCNDPNVYHKSCMKYTYKIENLTTGNNSSIEANDTIRATLNFNTGSNVYKLYKLYAGFAHDKNFYRSDLYFTTNFFDIFDIPADQKTEHMVFEFNSTIENKLNAGFITTRYDDQKILLTGVNELKLTYIIARSYEDYVGSIQSYSDEISLGTITITAEKDYIWGTEKNQTIYDNREAISEILDRNARFNGEDETFERLLQGLEMWYNPQTGMADGTELQDSSVANSFKIVANNNVYLTGLAEKDLYDILQIIGE